MNREFTTYYLILFIVLLISVSCSDRGCTDPDAYNYDSSAEKDAGSCYYTPGCTDYTADNYDYSADYDDGTCYYSIGENIGRLTIYRLGYCWEGDITVLVNGVNKGVLQYYFDSLVSCMDYPNDLISYELDTGYYNLRAESIDGTIWEGEIEILRNSCVDVQLKCGGYIEGEAYINDEETGEIMIWTANNFGGDISVQVDNEDAGYVRLVYDSIPECGADGCVTKVNLAPGMYTIHAQYGQYIWNNYTIKVIAGRCTKFQLQ